MSGKSSRTKGHSWEREVAIMLRSIFPEARRGLQYQDGMQCSDVVNTPIHVECKRCKKVDYRAAMRQARAECRPGYAPVVVAKDDREDAVVMMLLDDWIDLVKEWKERTE